MENLSCRVISLKHLIWPAYSNNSGDTQAVWRYFREFVEGWRRWVFGLAVKTPVKTLSHSRMPPFDSWLCSLKISINVNPGGQQIAAEVAGFLTLTWEIWTDFSGSCAGCTHSSHLVSESANQKIGLMFSLSLSLSLPLFYPSNPSSLPSFPWSLRLK